MNIQALNRYAQVLTKYTRDIATLELSPYQLVFLCDDLMVGCPNQSVIVKHSARKERAFTQKKFEFLIKDSTGQGIPVLKDDGLRIKGEIHAIPSDKMPLLDTYMENGVQFLRRRVKFIKPYRDHVLLEIGREQSLISLPRGSITTKNEIGLRHYVSDEIICILEAWMYISLKSYWKDILDGGYLFSRCPIFEPKEDKPWLTRYYQYPKNEDT